jgi:hypothetical protein
VTTPGFLVLLLTMTGILLPGPAPAAVRHSTRDKATPAWTPAASPTGGATATPPPWTGPASPDALTSPPAAAPHASRWFFQAVTGYSWTRARQLEEAVHKHLELNREVFEDNLAALGSTGGTRLGISNTGGGSCTTVEAGYRLGEGWGTGLRFGSMRGPSVSGFCTGRGSRGERLDVLWDFDYRMTWLTTGVWMEGGRKARFRGGMSAGLGWGKLAGGWALSYDFKTPLLEPFTGSLYDEAKGKGLVLEFGGDASYPLREGLSAVLSASYRAAKGSLLEAVETGDAELDSYLAHLEIDFGGMALQGGLRFSF